MELELDIKSKLLSFDSFIHLVTGFRSETGDDKLNRFF